MNKGYVRVEIINHENGYAQGLKHSFDCAITL